MNYFEDESEEVKYEKEYHYLESKIKILSQSFLWNGSEVSERLQDWQSNFNGQVKDSKIELHNAMFLLSQFMFFNDKTIRNFLQSIYKDLIVKPIIDSIRRNNENTIDLTFIQENLNTKLSLIKFIPIGKISGSGAMISYLFRQATDISEEQVILASDLYNSSGNLNFPEIEHYILIDDLAGSGTQVCDFVTKHKILNLKIENKHIQISYLPIFSTSIAIEKIKKSTFHQIYVNPLFELDESYQVYSQKSRYFSNVKKHKYIGRLMSKYIFKKYAKNLNFIEENSLGYSNTQLMLAFSHNTPDNTLPLFWEDSKWNAIFKRYNKK
ncbi:phosphoribosyltransferase-like protein [Malaciobacter mytili]|nr:hypothetical protein [Malaciobacter mytili]